MTSRHERLPTIGMTCALVVFDHESLSIESC